jgi:hypothetical protein
MGHQGTVAEVAGSLEWKAASDGGARYVTLSARDGITTVRGSANLTNGANLTFLPAGIISACIFVPFLAAFLKGANPLGVILYLGFLPFLYAGLRAIWKRVSAKESEKLETAVAELARLAAGQKRPTE